MAVTELQRAKRALLAVMLALGRLYGCILGVNRDSPDQEVTSALRRLVKMVHPDKGGKAADAPPRCEPTWRSTALAPDASGDVFLNRHILEP